MLEPETQCPVDNDIEEKKRQVARLAPRIKENARREQNKIVPRREIVEEEEKGKEIKEERD